MSENRPLQNKRIAKNALFLSVRMLLVMLVSLYTSRVILKALGVEDFGIYNVVGGIVSLFAFVNGAMSNATQRYIAFELGKSENRQVTNIFSACMIIHLFIAFLIFAFAETIGLYILNNHLTIPDNRLQAANWVYQLSILSCIIMVISTPYNGAIVAHERMNFFAYISLLEVLLRLIVAYLIAYQPMDKLIYYAILLLGVQTIVRWSYSFYCKRYLPDIRFYMIRNKSMYQQLYKFMGWTLFNNMSIIACTQGINLVLNIFFNPAVNAARGIAVQVETSVTSFSKNFQMALNPQIIKSYSMNDRMRFYTLIFWGSKLSFFLLLLLAFPIIMHVDYILKLWLNMVPAYTAIFTKLVILVSLVNVLSDPLLTGVSATGAIRYFQLVSGILLISVLPFSAFIFQYWNNPAAIFWIYLTVSIIVYGYKFYYCIKYISLPILPYFRQVIGRVTIVSVCGILAYVCYQNNITITHFGHFIMSIIISMCFIGTCIFSLGLSSKEKRKVICYLKERKIFKRLSNKK